MRPRITAVTRGRLFTFVLALLTLRVLSLITVYFFEEDEVSLAIGVAALLSGTPGHMYRYAVQVGYYRGVQCLALLLGGQVSTVPWIMKGLSAVAGTAIPLSGWTMFRRELQPHERLLTALALVVNPALWQSARYGNTAIVSTAIGLAALAALTNPRTRLERVLALVALSAAVLVRGDAALLWPVTALLILRGTGSWRATIEEVGGVGLAFTAAYVALMFFDPRMDNATAAVAQHMGDTPNPSQFWEFLLWALSPAAAVFAIWGARRLLDTNPALLGVLLVWMLPTLLFYFRATTTTRYFLNVAAPFAVLSAVGMSDAAALARRWLPARAAWGLVGAAASVHLVIALGHVPPPRPLEHFYGGTFGTHDGPMPTGALLVRGLLTPGSLLRGLPRPRFAAQSTPFWEGVAFEHAVAELAAEPPGRTVVLRLTAGFGHAFHYHAQAAGAVYENGPGDRVNLWGDAIRLRLGETRVFTIGHGAPAYRALRQFPVKDGDALWVLDTSSGLADLQAKMPPGLTLRPTATFDEHFTTFEIVAATPRQEGAQ